MGKNSTTGRVGYGIAIRNHVGAVLASSTQVAGAFFSPMVAEAMAILTGLEFAQESGLFPCMVESNAQIVVKLIQSDIVPLSEVGIVIRDIR
ncbi:hypothetical protein Ddye_025886 [Dipteronia dyeriana]|uniref:RNase H type-1 domain-containing protein n=1 Tax=Dipteronia dyeriana TaxID=168575 RepID=A0AAD9TLP5_9ROSI|nr:hypothetical protein Ddye_025886 [Dipteronia dyeriana]